MDFRLKWKILHVVGGESSVWQVRQLACQYRRLPEELFEQKISAGEERVARQVESQVLQPVVRLGRRMKIEYSAARNLYRLARDFDPDLVVCWDIQATEQLKLARLGGRRPMTAAVMLFSRNTDRQLLYKLKANYHHLGLHLICGSRRLAQWASTELTLPDRTHCVYPIFEKAAENMDRAVLRRQMGLDPESICVFVPTEGKWDDIHRAFVGCGIIERIDPRMRIVILGDQDERAGRLRQYARSIIVPRILHVIRDWNPSLVVAGCDMLVQPVNTAAETLGLLEAFGQSVPVISSCQAEPAELLVPDETFLDIGRAAGRIVATGIYRLLTDETFRNRMVTAARAAVARTCSPLEYRANVVKLYQYLLTRQNER